MRASLAEASEFLQIAMEALRRYKLRTSLSVLGVVLGVAAVIAMMSVSDGARREALIQVDALGLDNLIARTRGSSGTGLRGGLVAADAERLQSLVPSTRAASAIVERYLRVTWGEQAAMAPVLGVGPSYETILRLRINDGRFLSVIDESAVAQVTVLGGSLARRLFGYRDPIGERIRIGELYYGVIGILGGQGANVMTPGTLAWRDLNEAALVPLPVLTGLSLSSAPDQPVDEIWLQLQDSERIEELAEVFDHALERLHRGHQDFETVVPRELLAQRFRTQQTFSVVVGSVAALALIVGGIGIMNIMLTSVVERTTEIGVRRTVGATRRDVTLQFLIEALLMTLSGGVLGVIVGIATSWGITAYAGWSTHVSALAIGLAFLVSFLVGVVFGLYPATRAANLQPVDALRYE